MSTFHQITSMKLQLNALHMNDCETVRMLAFQIAVVLFRVEGTEILQWH